MTTEESVRALAKRLRARHPAFDPVELERDPDFARAVELLAVEPAELLESLTRKRKSPYLAAIALAAIAARAAASQDWTTRMVRAPPIAPDGLAYFLFRALAAAAEGRVLRPLLYRIVPSWVEEPLLGPLGGLVEARLAAGERFDADDFGGAFVAEEEPLVLRLVDSLPDHVQAELRPGLRRWQRTLVGEEWFRSFARVRDPSAAAAPATLVGDRAPAVDLVLEALTARPPRSILLVGEHGTGKRTLAYEAVRRLDPADWFVFEATAADVIAGQQYIGDVEGRLQEIGNRCRGRRVVWLFPSFGDALWAGQWSRGPRGVLDRMLPLLQAGDVAVVGMITPAAHELIMRVRPPTAEAFDAVRLRPSSPEDTLRVAHDWLETAGVDEPDDLADTFELAMHYLPAVAPPGNLIRLLRLTRDRTARDGAPDVSSRRALETLAEATGLPLAVLDPAVPLDVDGARAFFTSRVLGQPEAVECLVERIAMVKAGLADPTRPLGVFLFVGPTGTGKTEIAKALAEYLFGSPDRLVRLDMSEYQTWESFERLLAAGDERGEASPLLASVRAQPFSVILLDEFEKAARPVHDLFLQVFDDGRLTDRAGRTADFRHCVIVLTSNAGSAIRVRPGLGFSGAREGFDPGTVERAVESRFRAEFLNRLDRVVVFRPLGREVMRSLLEQELSAVLSRPGLRSRPWAVEWDDAALDLLIERGFSEQYGARPLRRAVERHLLAPLALTMAAHEVPRGEQFLFISARDGSIDVSFVDPDGDEPAEPASPPGRLEQIVCDPRGSAEAAAFLRAELARVEEAFAGWDERKDELLEQMRDPGFWTSDARVETLALAEVIDRFDAALGTARSLAERLRDRAPAARLVALLANRLYVLDRALHDLERGETGDVLIAVRPQGGEPATAFARELACMYEAWAERRGTRIEPLPLGGDELAFGVSGLGASTMLAGEPGLHVLELPREGRSPQRATVAVAAVPAGDGGPERLREALSGPRPVVRRYRRDPSPLVRDAVRGWRTGRLDRVLGGDFDVMS